MTDGVLTSPGRVLVVDGDEAAMRDVCTVLQDAGYDAIGCASPREAILAIVRGDEYDVILCDTGIEIESPMGLYDQIAAVDPALAERIVLMGAEPARVPVRSHPPLAKPVDAEAVRACIDEFVARRTMAPARAR